MTVPDGATAQESGGDQGAQHVGTPQEQVDQQVLTSRLGWFTSLFGHDVEQQSGGGGEGGTYMFANLDELDSVIKTWEGEIRAIADDQHQIRGAGDAINQPAKDAMSALQAESARKSLNVMWEHNRQMQVYAETYLVKLQKARKQMAATEDSAHTGMKNVYPA